METLLIDIEGRDLPGRRCHPDSEGEGYENIHVYLGRRNEPRDLTPGFVATTATWRLEVAIKPDGSGGSVLADRWFRASAENGTWLCIGERSQTTGRSRYSGAQSRALPTSRGRRRRRFCNQVNGWSVAWA